VWFLLLLFNEWRLNLTNGARMNGQANGLQALQLDHARVAPAGAPTSTTAVIVAIAAEGIGQD